MTVSLKAKNKLSKLFQGIDDEQATLSEFDLVGIDIKDERDQVLVFARDMRTSMANLHNDLAECIDEAGGLLLEYAAETSSKKRTELIVEAAKRLLHEDFKLIPGFSVAAGQADEWKNALDDSYNLLRYLHTEKSADFPVDDWLYGMARVREKMHHLENAVFFSESLAGNILELKPVQFPYREHDYWLAMPYPDTVKETGKAFEINEDKILYTAVYVSGYDKEQPQCGLLIDEWTEVIPSQEITAGLAFHFDQPNSEPPQTLLLATPSDFRGGWQWKDLVDTLLETLDMAKKRAVEPDQIDSTGYGRFLPALMSAVTAYPITAALKLAVNNEYHLKAIDNE